MSPTLYFGTVGMSTWYSADLGETIERLRSDSGLYSESRVWGLSAHPAAPNEVLAASDSGVHRLDRSVQKWAPVPSPMDAMNVWSIAQAPDNPDVVLAGTCPAMMFRSEDRGKTWTKITAPFAATCPFVVRPRITQILFDPDSASDVWATVEIDGVWRSQDQGRSWKKCSAGLVSEDGHGIAIARKDGKRLLYMTTNKGLHVSEDDGESWQHRKLDTPWPYTRAIAPRADRNGTMFLCNGDTVPGSTGILLRSRDYGETWEDAGLPGELKSTPWCIATNPADPSLVFVSTCFGKYFRSTDGGESWTKLSRELGETRALLWMPA